MSDRTITSIQRSRASYGRIDAPTVALRALGWILGDEQRASRFLALTGLEPEDLRTRIADAAIHAAVLDYLAAHEADLLSCADALEIAPEAIQVAAREIAE